MLSVYGVIFHLDSISRNIDKKKHKWLRQRLAEAETETSHSGRGAKTPTLISLEPINDDQKRIHFMSPSANEPLASDDETYIEILKKQCKMCTTYVFLQQLIQDNCLQ